MTECESILLILSFSRTNKQLNAQMLIEWAEWMVIVTQRQKKKNKKIKKRICSELKEIRLTQSIQSALFSELWCHLHNASVYYSNQQLQMRNDCHRNNNQNILSFHFTTNKPFMQNRNTKCLSCTISRIEGDEWGNDIKFIRLIDKRSVCVLVVI